VATSGELLAGAIERLREAGSETARLDAEVLLAHTLRTDRASLIAHPEWLVSTDAVAGFDDAVARRLAGEPVAYIRGIKEFHGIALAADARALIPRPETEQLVEAILAETMARLTGSRRRDAEDPVRIADVGTGGGAVAIAVSVELRRRRVPMTEMIRILATEVSPDALDLARENAVSHAVADTVRFLQIDLLPSIPPEDRAFDIVAANLPYVRSDAIPLLPVAASFEPPMALDGGPDGLDVIRRLLVMLPKVLADDGVALFEIGGDQGEDAPAAVAKALPGWSSSVAPDLGGLPRVMRVARDQQ
jgi:release factor glutamine methyltransferase